MKRFYKQASAQAVEDGWQVMLDGRGVRTAQCKPQIVPTAALASMLATEWADQGEEIDPARFALRDLADYAIDVVALDREAAIAEILPFGETDTLCYRAEPGDALRARQEQAWEPVLTACERRYDVHFERISGIVHRPQPPATLTRLKAVVLAQDPFTLAALQTLASLAASLVIGLSALNAEAQAETLWSVANLEEDWQAELWGKDALAEERRARRLSTFSAALAFLRAARAG